MMTPSHPPTAWRRPAPLAAGSATAAVPSRSTRPLALLPGPAQPRLAHRFGPRRLIWDREDELDG